MSVEIKLTGRTRVRPLSRWFRSPVLIMQVEEQRKGYVLDGWGGTNHVDCVEWRDARVEDFVSPYAIGDLT